MVVATDASEGGAGTLDAQGYMVLVDLFAGLGAARLALENLGVEVKVHIAIEEDTHGLRVLAENFSDAVIVRGVQQLSSETLLDPVRMVDRKALVLILCGPPFMDANKVLRGRTCPHWVQWVKTVFLDEGRSQHVEVGTELADRMDD
eukprot:5676107-Amphidinium_carterae.1